MKRGKLIQIGLVVLGVGVVCGPVPLARADALLPDGVKVVWDAGKAYRETTPTRERICLNGLWRWQPAPGGADGPLCELPSRGWGYFKVPGPWPGITDYMQKDCQTVYADPSWKSLNLASVRSAWYQREMTIPAGWRGRRIAVTADYVNSFATVYVDGKKAGEIRFPAGEVDITAFCTPGRKHLLSLLVEAMPLKAVRLSHTDTNSARQVQGSVPRRGLCGDVWLTSEPTGARIVSATVSTSVSRGEIRIRANLARLRASDEFKLIAHLSSQGRPAGIRTSRPFRLSELSNGSFSFSAEWQPNSLWDIHTPRNQCSVRLSLVRMAGRPGLIGRSIVVTPVVTEDEALPILFGFREFVIKGRDFYLNGTRIFLSSVPLDNAQVGAAWASYAGAKESLRRLKSIGINFVYTHNYDCEPGSHVSFAEILRAADDVGMLVAVSQPHFSAYDWKSPDAEQTNGYAGLAEFYVRQSQNHPSVVAYAMSHNATSYDEAKNPDLIDGIYDQRDTWSANNVRQARRAEAIVRKLDPSRIVYHHSSGNLGALYTENFYTNFTPKQELSDWFEHWATKGVKPLFLCEFGVPITWDWTTYRGWYKGKREWGSANVPWDFSLAEWSAQFHGDLAYRLTEQEKANIRWEAKQYRAGREGWHRWDYPHAVGSNVFDGRMEIIGEYVEESWRALRTWGVSAFGPWEHELFWWLRPGVDRGRKSLPVDWEKLQRPGFSADFLDQRYERMDLAYEVSDWMPTAAAKALVRNNGPVLAYIADVHPHFTGKSHNFRGGELVTKQIILVNNSRQPVTAQCRWTIGIAGEGPGTGTVRVETGRMVPIPIGFPLSAHLSAGRYPISATVRFSTGEVQTDTFTIDVVKKPEPLRTAGRIALFDPKGETGKLLKGLGVHCQPVGATADLSAYGVLIVGKGALTPNGLVPDVRRVRDGLKVIVFEQTAEALERRLGFRVAEYGLRNVFTRVSGHPLLQGLTDANLHDWRGEATLLPPRLEYTLKPMYGPMVKWCGFDVPRAWRCGNRGNVASVLIEKPARGDFLPIVDGGFSLQYSPLMVYREGLGMAVFCQLDVTGRTETDPAADQVVRNLLRFASEWKPAADRRLYYVGEPAGRAHLERAGFTVERLPGSSASNSMVVVGPGAEKEVSSAQLAAWRGAGAQFVAAGIVDPYRLFDYAGIKMSRGEHIACEVRASPPDGWLAGISSADAHNRDPREILLATDGAEVVGNGVLARTATGEAAFTQIVPWQFDPAASHVQKKTFRRASFLLTRLLCNLGAACSSPLLDDMAKPVSDDEKRWLHGLYLDTPEDWDDPYRFFPW